MRVNERILIVPKNLLAKLHDRLLDRHNLIRAASRAVYISLVEMGVALCVYNGDTQLCSLCIALYRYV